MDFSLTEEHLMIRDAARDFAQTELLPGVIERDNTQSFPDELVRKMGELGFMGIMVDPKYGGSGMDTISYVLIMEELSKIDASCPQNTLCILPQIITTLFYFGPGCPWMVDHKTLHTCYHTVVPLSSILGPVVLNS